MATKNNPGEFDCHAAAEDDEPIFTLRARDPLAPTVVRVWLAMRKETRFPRDERERRKQAEAEQCAKDMMEWAGRRALEKL